MSIPHLLHVPVVTPQAKVRFANEFWILILGSFHSGRSLIIRISQQQRWVNFDGGQSTSDCISLSDDIFEDRYVSQQCEWFELGIESILLQRKQIIEKFKITIKLEAKSWRFRSRSFPDFARIYRSSEGTSIVCKNLVLLRSIQDFQRMESREMSGSRPISNYIWIQDLYRCVWILIRTSERTLCYILLDFKQIHENFIRQLKDHSGIVPSKSRSCLSDYSQRAVAWINKCGNLGLKSECYVYFTKWISHITAYEGRWVPPWHRSWGCTSTPHKTE